MSGLWTGLIPLILGSALVPIEIVVTIMLLGTPSRVRAAGAWVAGMVLARLLQGVVFGLILHWGARAGSPDDSHGWIVSTILLVAAVLFLVTAARELFGGDDPDAPPPKWMTMLARQGLPARRGNHRGGSQVLGVHARRHRRDR